MKEKILKLVLRISGIILLTALVPVVMPFEWMQDIHRWLGMGELPDKPIVGYLTRSISLLYALHGALIFYVSLDIRRYLPFIKFIAVLGVIFGAGMVVLDYGVNMPDYWILCEGPFVVPLSLVILWLAASIPENSC